MNSLDFYKVEYMTSLRAIRQKEVTQVPEREGSWEASTAASSCVLWFGQRVLLSLFNTGSCTLTQAKMQPVGGGIRRLAKQRCLLPSMIP